MILHRLRHVLLVAALLAAAPPVAAQEPPVVRVTDIADAPGGASGAFVGRVDGELGVLKGSASQARDPLLAMRSGNVEAEYLTSRILEVAGIDAPRVRLVRIAGRRGLFAFSPYVDRTFAGQPVTKTWAAAGLPAFPANADAAAARRWQLEYAGRFDADSVRRLQVLDLWIGNGDRNRGNAFLATGPDGKLRLVPIDHDRALVTRSLKPDSHLPAGAEGFHRHLTAGFEGQASFAPAASVAGTPARILLGNEIYEAIARTSTPEQYRAAAAELASRFNDGTIARLVAELPAETPAARRQELASLLTARRDGLPAAAASLHANPGARSADRLAQRLAFEGRPVTSAMREFIAGTLLAPDGTVRAASAYESLRASGASPADARRAVQAGVELLRWDGPAPDAIALERTLAGAEQRVSGRPAPGGGLRSTLSEAVTSARMRLALFGVDRAPLRARLQDLDRRHATIDHALAKLRATETALAPECAERALNRGTQARLVDRQRTLIDEYVTHAERLGEQHGRGPERALVERTLAAARAQELPPVRARAPTATAAARGPTAAGAARASLTADLRGGLVVTALISATADILSRRQQGASADVAARDALAGLARPEFLIGDLAGGMLGAAVGSAIPLPGALAAATGFTGALARSLPPLALSMVAARLGASAIQLSREGKLTVSNLAGSIDIAATAMQVLGGALGAQLALSAIGAGLLPALALGPVALVPVLAGVAGAMAAERLLAWWRSRPGESPHARPTLPAGQLAASPGTSPAGNSGAPAATRVKPPALEDLDDPFAPLRLTALAVAEPVPTR